MYSLKINKKNIIGKTEGLMTDYYEVVKKLGQGTYGKIYSVKNKTTGEIRACKQLSKHMIQDKTQFQTEIEIMITLTHPNILKLYEVFEDERYYYLIIEKCNGGELFEKIQKKISEGKLYSEKDIAKIFEQFISAIAYCHANGICHRDLKPENILFLKEGSEENNPIKVIDFGVGGLFKESNSKMKIRVGSAYYMAPEVIKGKYNEKCDVWSAGVILYILLTGTPPFIGNTDNEIYTNILSGKYPVDNLKKVSKNAKDLISKMLCPEDKRLSASDVLNDKWFKKMEEKRKKKENDDLIEFDFNKFIKYEQTNKIKKLALTFIASRINDTEVENLKNFFIKIDENKDGTITFQEFKKGIEKMNIDLNTEELKEMFKSFDTNLDGTIDYLEFIAGSLSEKDYLKEERLYETFCALDKDHSGKLSIDEIKKVFEGENDEKIQKMLKSIDKNGDGQIDYNEFLDLMGFKR